MLLLGVSVLEIVSIVTGYTDLILSFVEIELIIQT